MKKNILRAAALILAVLLLTTCFASCANGKKLFSLGKEKITLNLYELYLSRQKGTLCSAYYYGSKAKADSFWDTTISVDGTTYNDYWTSYMIDCVKNYLAALYLFEEEYKLTLPDSAMDSVKEKLDDLVEMDGDGSKTALNAVLSNYGVNYDMLREAYIIEEKVNYLRTYLYGADLSKVSDELKEQYYQDNYVRFKQVFFANYDYVYEVDSDGTEIYFDTESGEPVYDSSTGIRRFDESGKALTDDAGHIIYYNEDGTIAYDKEKGTRSNVYNDDGSYKTYKYSAEKLRELAATAEDIAEFTEKGDSEKFEQYIKDYSNDENGQELYSDGYYFAKGSQYAYQYIVDIIAELVKMENGEVRVVESDYGYHVIMKYSLDEGAYADSDKDVWFESFVSDVSEWLFSEKCSAYFDKITINDELIGNVDMKSVEPNYYY